jgi:outer membrane autotransporter protein
MMTSQRAVRNFASVSLGAVAVFLSTGANAQAVPGVRALSGDALRAASGPQLAAAGRNGMTAAIGVEIEAPAPAIPAGPFAAQRAVSEAHSRLSGRTDGSFHANAAVPGIPERADACGELVGGEATCTAADPVNEGVYYSAPGDVTVHLEDGLVIAPAAGLGGVIAVSEEGIATIDGAGATIRTENASGAVAERANGVVIDLASVSVEMTDPDAFAFGIAAASPYGTIAINAGEVKTKGDYTTAIIAEGASSDVFINAGKISTDGFASDGVVVRTGGAVDIQVGTIESTGEYNWGVNVTNGGYVDDALWSGPTNVAVESIKLSGDNNRGVNVFTLTDTEIQVGKLESEGSNGTGVYVTAYGNAGVRIGDLSMSGTDNTGVLVQALGRATVAVENATFTGTGGGILAFGAAGGAEVKVGTLTTEMGGGIQGASEDGDVSIEAGTVRVNGDMAVGIFAGSTYGKGTVRVGEVSTNGMFAHGVKVDALHGDVLVHAGKISTEGEQSYGIKADGKTTLVTVDQSMTTKGAGSFGVITSSTDGDAVVVAKGAVDTRGEMADALSATGRYGTGRVLASGTVSTHGDLAEGINARGESGQVEVQAQNVTTSGANSHGILARTLYAEWFMGEGGPNPYAFTGDVDIAAANVTVTGADSLGISARGLGKATIVAGNVSSAKSHAIETNMIGDVALDLRGTVKSGAAAAVRTTGADVSVNLGAGAQVIGATDGLVISAAGKRCVLPNPDDGVTPNPCPNPGYSDWRDEKPGFSEFGNSLGVPQVGIGGVAAIVNSGTIQAQDGYAIRLASGRAVIDNRGRIEGGVLLGAGDDQFDNSGTFAIGRDSDFGTGVDVLRNSGAVKLASAKAAASYKLAGLERFENSGTIDLGNKIAGDVLTLSGDYRGSGNAALLLDIDTAAGRGDQLVIQGDATGSTRVAVAATAGTAQLTDAAGIVLVKVAGDSTADAFALDAASRDIGFVNYALGYDAANGDYRLTGRAGAAAYRMVGAVQAAENLWDASADLLRTANLSKRDAQLAGQGEADTSRLWGVLQGGRLSRNLDTTGASGAIDLDYRQTRQGGQVGFDLLNNAGDTGLLRVGVTGGYADSTLNFRNSGDRIELSTANVGLYAGYVGERAFANLLVKYDRHDLTARSGALADDADFDGSTWGVDGEVGLRMGSAGMFIEPTAGLAWMRTSLDDLADGNQRLAFRDSDGFKGRIGARFGGTSVFANGNALTVYLSGNLAHRFGSDYAADLVSGASQRIKFERLGTTGEGQLGLSYRTAAGFQAFVEGQGETGSGYSGVTGRAGFRIGF